MQALQPDLGRDREANRGHPHDDLPLTTGSGSPRLGQGTGDLGNPGADARGPEAPDREQRLGLGRRRTVAIGPLSRYVLDSGRISRLHEPAVGLEAKILPGDIGVGDGCLHRQVDGYLERYLDRLALELGDRL